MIMVKSSDVINFCWNIWLDIVLTIFYRHIIEADWNDPFNLIQTMAEKGLTWVLSSNFLGIFVFFVNVIHQLDLKDELCSKTKIITSCL